MKNNIRSIVVENDPLALDALCIMITENTPHVEVIGRAESVSEAIEVIRLNKPDLVFLDIQLREGTAFKILEACSPVTFQIIFTTAYSEFALRAIKYAALDYLLKPIDPKELTVAVKKCTPQNKDGLALRVEVLEEHISRKDNGWSLGKLMLSDSNGFKLVLMQNIVRCLGERNYTTFFFVDGSKMTVSKSIGEYERLLPGEHFYRVFKSHLVNLRFVEQYKKGRAGYLILHDGSEIPISRDKKHDILQRLQHLHSID